MGISFARATPAESITPKTVPATRFLPMIIESFLSPMRICSSSLGLLPSPPDQEKISEGKGCRHDEEDLKPQALPRGVKAKDVPGRYPPHRGDSNKPRLLQLPDPPSGKGKS